jgi:hypothetical protein
MDKIPSDAWHGMGLYGEHAINTPGKHFQTAANCDRMVVWQYSKLPAEANKIVHQTFHIAKKIQT